MRFFFRKTEKPSVTENTDDLLHPEKDRAFLSHSVSDRVHHHPAMLGAEERQLPAYISASMAERPGTIVELGCYLGGSTVAILDGLNHCGKLGPEPRKAIHSYDLFRANEFMVEHSLAPFGIASGESFRPAFSELLGDWSPYVEVHEGDILDETWPAEPIKLLYVDILWSWETNQHVFDQFYRRLEKGSWLIHQDYVYSAYPWLPISMEWLVENGYFAFRSFARHSTVSFECLRSPGEVEQNFSFNQELSLSEKRRLLQKAVSRFSGYPQALLRLADGVMLAHLGETRQASACVREVERSYTHPFVADHVKMVRDGLKL